MKIELWAIGKTNEAYLESGISIYQKRLSHYLKFDFVIIPDIRKAGKLNPEQLKVKEGEVIMQKIQQGDYLILLDEKGKQYTSVAFANMLEQLLPMSYKRIIFLIGGAFGFAPAVYQRADSQISLSKMTFSHQMIRLFFVEQLYRGMTILKNEKYHNH
jgi:23S rRNA (pseudouridine1915-N3)-methyltransferase